MPTRRERMNEDDFERHLMEGYARRKAAQDYIRDVNYRGQWPPPNQEGGSIRDERIMDEMQAEIDRLRAELRKIARPAYIPGGAATLKQARLIAHQALDPEGIPEHE